MRNTNVIDYGLLYNYCKKEKPDFSLDINTLKMVLSFEIRNVISFLDIKFNTVSLFDKNNNLIKYY